MIERPDGAISHDDLWLAIDSSRKRFENWLVGLVMFILPLSISAFIWVWSSHTAQAEWNGGMEARVQQHMLNEERGIDRIQDQLDEMNRYLREQHKH